MKKTFVLIFVAVLIAVIVHASTVAQIPEPARPMPYTDFLTIESTGQVTIATTTLLVSSADGGYVLINNESGDILRIGTDTAALTNGFGLPVGAVIGMRLWKGQSLYVDCTGSANISYIKGN